MKQNASINHLNIFDRSKKTIGKKALFGFQPKMTEFLSGALCAPDLSIYQGKGSEPPISRAARAILGTQTSVFSGLKRDVRYTHF